MTEKASENRPKETGLPRTIDTTIDNGSTDLVESESAELASFRQSIDELRSELIRLEAMPESPDGLTDILRASAVNAKRESNWIGVLYHPPSGGEPATHPHIRVAPIQSDHVTKLFRGVPLLDQCMPLCGVCN